jgi:hypothetical protein
MSLNTTLIIRSALYIAVIVIMILQMRICKRFAEPFAWMMVGINGIIYNIVITIDRWPDGLVDSNFYNIWSAAIIIQFLLTLSVIEIMRYLRIRGRIGC